MNRPAPTTTRRSPLRSVALFALLVTSAVLAGSCSGADEPEATGEGAALSPAAIEGREVAQRNGCTSCHAVEGSEGIGPSWAGVYGSEVQLDDGTTVTADDEYLTTSIVDPSAQIVEGYRGIMPERSLDPAEVEAIVAYLREL